MREPWRLGAFAAQKIAGDGFLRRAPGLVRFFDESKWQVLARAVERGVNSPLCCSAGRLFDCVSALLGVRGTTNYEGQAAVELEALAHAWLASKYGAGGSRGLKALLELKSFEITIARGVVAWEPVISGILEAERDGVETGELAARFHKTVADIVLEVALAARREREIDRVALTGGCFMNELLHVCCTSLLKEHGFTVYVHSTVPANDGGISFGQAAVAAAVLAASR